MRLRRKDEEGVLQWFCLCIFAPSQFHSSNRTFCMGLLRPVCFLRRCRSFFFRISTSSSIEEQPRGGLRAGSCLLRHLPRGLVDDAPSLPLRRGQKFGTGKIIFLYCDRFKIYIQDCLTNYWDIKKIYSKDANTWILCYIGIFQAIKFKKLISNNYSMRQYTIKWCLLIFKKYNLLI